MKIRLHLNTLRSKLQGRQANLTATSKTDAITYVTGSLQKVIDLSANQNNTFDRERS